MCEKTKGNWRAFNSSCTDSCESKFDSLFCTSFPFYACDCGDNRCWDGNKCILEKVAKIAYDKRKQEQEEARKAELESVRKQNEAIAAQVAAQAAQAAAQAAQAAAQAAAQSQAAAPIAGETESPYQQQPTNPLTTSTETLPPLPVDPILTEINNKKMESCTTEKGIWTQFQNGCADYCATKVSEFTICTETLTWSCKCPESKCWDNAKDSCIDLEEYKKSFSPFPGKS